MAAKYGRTAVVETLLERCNNVDVEGRNSLTALHVATQYNRQQVIVLLLAHHASTQQHAKVSPAVFLCLIDPLIELCVSKIIFSVALSVFLLCCVVCRFILANKPLNI